MTEKGKKRWSLLTGIIVGGAVGSVTSLLFAPARGAKTREQVAKKGREIFDEGKTKAEAFLEKYKK